MFNSLYSGVARFPLFLNLVLMNYILYAKIQANCADPHQTEESDLPVEDPELGEIMDELMLAIDKLPPPGIFWRTHK